MCSDARIDTSGATDLSIRATRSSTFCHGAVPQDAADEGFIVGSGPIIIGHAAEFDAGSRAWAWEPYIESVLARRRQVPNDLAPVTTSVARRGFEPLTSSLKAMGSRKAAWQISQARIETGFARKRASEKRPTKEQSGGQQAPTTWTREDRRKWRRRRTPVTSSPRTSPQEICDQDEKPDNAGDQLYDHRGAKRRC